MTVQISLKDQYIEVLRKNGFNCFPIPKYPQEEPEQKKADYRYKASRTEQNQTIKYDENFGYIPILGTGTCIIDFDNKEKYREFAEENIKNGYMVIESPNGWHIPCKGLTGNIQKVMLYDYLFEPNKQIVEIQGYDHYCIGPESEIFNHKTKQFSKYINRGTLKIWDAKGGDFHKLIDLVCKKCKVQSKKRNSRSSNKNLRDRFLDNKPPTKGTSNDYFFQAAIQCKNDGLTQNEAIEKIKIVYDLWTNTQDYSHRPFSNVEAKIQEVYEKEENSTIGGRPTKEKQGIDRTQIAQDMITDRRLYSDVNTREIFENCNGFLEKINDELIHELVKKYPYMEEADYRSISFKIVGLAEPIPETNKNLIVFKNGVFDQVSHEIIETDEIADMGFKEYDYLKKKKENEPTKFLEIMFGNVPESEHSRIKAGLRAILTNRLDPKISIIHGESGVGKSTGLLILVEIMGKYGMAVELDQLLQDRFIRAKINGLRLLVLQDLPQVWKDFAQIKTMTGEQKKTERGFMQDSVMFENKLKIFASTNYLAKIPEHEQNAMYSRRLSLIHNIKVGSFKENPTLIEDVAKEEGEKIISWILNLTDNECQYEDGNTVKEEWERISSPEIEYLENNYDLTDNDSEISVMALIKEFKEKTKKPISLDLMKKTLESQGFIIKLNVIKNIQKKNLQNTIYP